MGTRYYVAPSHYGAENIEDGAVFDDHDLCSEMREVAEHYAESRAARYGAAGDIELIVRRVDGGDIKTFHVSVQMTPSATAKEVKAQPHSGKPESRCDRCKLPRVDCDCDETCPDCGAFLGDCNCDPGD